MLSAIHGTTFRDPSWWAECKYSEPHSALRSNSRNPISVERKVAAPLAELQLVTASVGAARHQSAGSWRHLSCV